MYQVIDSETNIKNTGEDAVGSMKADPFCPDNWAVWWGWKHGAFTSSPFIRKNKVMPVARKTDLLVGHNIKFDLHYMWKADHAAHDRMYTGGIRIWCTQLAEYLLTGQDSKWASLDQLAEKYGGTLKDSKMKEYWENGVDTEDIPEEELLPYLKGDIENTELVFLAQVKKAMDMEMMPLMVTQMEALLATAEMEFNGMAFDKTAALETAVEMSKEIRDLELQLMKIMEDRGVIDPNPASSQQVSAYLFGGRVKHIEMQPVLDATGKQVKYKSGAREGQTKFNKVAVVRTQPQFVKPQKGWANKEGYSVANDVLTELLRTYSDIRDATAGEVVEFIDLMLGFRRLQKDVKTYYVGFSKLTWPDGFIHGHFNHCNTNTGRLSSSSPNMQNVTTKEKE